MNEEFNNVIPCFVAFLPVVCMSGNYGQRIPPNSRNSHIYLHVPELTHGAHEACSIL
jgi:hypothetical protein